MYTHLCSIEREMPWIKTKNMNPSHLSTPAEKYQPVNAFHTSAAKKCHERHISNAKPHDLATWQKFRNKANTYDCCSTPSIYDCCPILSAYDCCPTPPYMTAVLSSLHMTAAHYILYRSASLPSVQGCCPILSVHDWLRHSQNDSSPFPPYSPVLVMCNRFQRLSWCFDNVIIRKEFPVMAELLHSLVVFQTKSLWKEKHGLDTKCFHW